MPNNTGLKAGIQYQDQQATAGLLIDLSARVLKTSIEATKQGALDNPSADRVASTKALKEVHQDIPNIVDLIDDTTLDSTDKTWSSSKIVNYIASKDDSEYFTNIDARDAYTVTPERDGLIGIVYDASADVGTDDNGDALGAIYVREAGAWKFLKTLGYRQVSFVGYLHENMLINDFVTDDPKKPLASSVAVALKSLIDTAQNTSDNTVMIPEVADIVWDSDNSQNKASMTFRPKGQIVGYDAIVIDSTGNQTPYVGEVVDENGVFKVYIHMENPIDLSANKVKFTYLHNSIANS